MYTTKLEQFSGPLDLLLQLIEQEKLDITQISLANVTNQFLEYLKQIETSRPEELADFLVIAAKLLLIKSKYLLPDFYLEKEESDLVNQLKIYREYLEAARKIQKIIKQNHFSFSRQKLSLVNIAEFKVILKITPLILEQSFKNILNLISQQLKLAQKTVKRMISLKDKIEELIKLIKKQQKLNLLHFIKKKKKDEAVVLFLAALEIIKQRIVLFEQKEFFGDIVLKRTN